MTAARDWLRARDTELEPRKMWTAGIGDAAGRGWKGRIAVDVAASRGRALAYADDPAWPSIDEVTAPPARDAAAPPWLLEGLDEVVARWRPAWVGFPAGVVVMPSARRPLLVRSLAERAAASLGLEVLDLLELHGPVPEPGLAPAARARAVAARLALRPGTTVPRPAPCCWSTTPGAPAGPRRSPRRCCARAGPRRWPRWWRTSCLDPHRVAL